MLILHIRAYNHMLDNLDLVRLKSVITVGDTAAENVV